jgi:hypothetical protein
LIHVSHLKNKPGTICSEPKAANRPPLINQVVLGNGIDVVTTEKTGRKQDGTFDKGSSGNPAGRPKGSLNKTTLAARELLQDEAERLTRKVVELALDGDLAALRLCLDRVLPRRQPAIELSLGKLEGLDDVRLAFERLSAAMEAGQISAAELSSINTLLDAHLKLFETLEFERRLASLEEAVTHANQAS